MWLGAQPAPHKNVWRGGDGKMEWKIPEAFFFVRMEGAFCVSSPLLALSRYQVAYLSGRPSGQEFF